VGYSGAREERVRRFSRTRKIGADTPISSPISGHRGSAQGRGRAVHPERRYDPVFVIGDLLDGWLTPLLGGERSGGFKVGQEIDFTCSGLPGRQFKSNIEYRPRPSNRRPTDSRRANIDNKEGCSKPECCQCGPSAAPTISAVGVPKQALIYEGDRVRLWVARRR